MNEFIMSRQGTMATAVLCWVAVAASVARFDFHEIMLSLGAACGWTYAFIVEKKD